MAYVAVAVSDIFGLKRASLLRLRRYLYVHVIFSLRYIIERCAHTKGPRNNHQQRHDKCLAVEESYVICWKSMSRLLETPVSAVVGFARAHINMTQNDFYV